jgi:hypothetical protein
MLFSNPRRAQLLGALNAVGALVSEVDTVGILNVAAGL